MDRWISTHCRTKPMRELVRLTMLNTMISVTSRLSSPYGRTSSIRILLNIEDAMPRMVVMTELKMA